MNGIQNHKTTEGGTLLVWKWYGCRGL